MVVAMVAPPMYLPQSCAMPLNSRCVGLGVLVGGGGVRHGGRERARGCDGRSVREEIGILISVADELVLLGQGSCPSDGHTGGRTGGLGLDGRQCLGKDGLRQSQHALVAAGPLLQGLRAGGIDAVRGEAPGQTDDAPELALKAPPSPLAPQHVIYSGRLRANVHIDPSNLGRIAHREPFCGFAPLNLISPPEAIEY